MHAMMLLFAAAVPAAAREDALEPWAAKRHPQDVAKRHAEDITAAQKEYHIVNLQNEQGLRLMSAPFALSRPPGRPQPSTRPPIGEAATRLCRLFFFGIPVSGASCLPAKKFGHLARQAR